ncbi:csnB [Candida pseudojiufengensis]|uniref:csnB n=1 Tax=Candida pseudojiufengensis TaxID=497109 RepID=UPI002225A8C0|nr:csnB [Candida pseudojiufengensis]KAI5965330.1 csnB [Candida pseudojiufengensis]
MSDEELYSEESYEFEFEDEDGNEGSDQDNDNIEEDEEQDIENRYYTAKALKDDDVKLAVTELEKLINSINETNTNNEDNEKNEIVFKSYKQLIKILYNEEEYEKVLNNLKNMIPLLPKLNKSYIEESISRMIGRYLNKSNNNNNSSISKRDNENKQNFVIKFSEILNDQSVFQNDKLWLKLNSNLLNFYLESNQYSAFENLLNKIHSRTSNIPESILKLFNLEIIAMEIEYLFKINTSDFNKLNKLYKSSLNNSTAVTHPKILAVINECGGKLQFYRENFEKSKNLFYNSFKNYDEAGLSRKNKILKQFLLISLLINDKNDNVDNFQSQETQTYSSFNEFNNLKNLIKNYRDLALIDFFQNLKKFELDNEEFCNDDIYKNSIELILEKLRIKILLKKLVENTDKKLYFNEIEESLHIDESQLEQILFKLMNQGKLSQFKINFIDKFIEYDSKNIIDSTTFLQQTNPKEIYYNVKLLESFKIIPNAKEEEETYNPDLMSDDVYIEDKKIQLPTDTQQQPAITELNSNDNFLSKLFYIMERPNKPEDWFKSIELWYSYIMSFNPKQHRLPINKEKETTTTTTNINANKELQNFNTGLLNSIIDGNESKNEKDYDYNDDDDDEDENLIQIKKINLIQTWINKLKE